MYAAFALGTLPNFQMLYGEQIGRQGHRGKLYPISYTPYLPSGVAHVNRQQIGEVFQEVHSGDEVWHGRKSGC